MDDTLSTDPSPPPVPELLPPAPRPQRSGCALVAIAVISGAIAGLAGCLLALAYFVPQIPSLSGSQGAPALGPLRPGKTVTSQTDLTIEGGDSEAIKRAIAKVMPAVVHVTQAIPQDVPIRTMEGGRDVGAGSGFIIDGKKGFVVTNAHVLANPGLPAEPELYVKLAGQDDSQRILARRLAVDPYHDLAVLKIDTGGKELPQLQFGDSEKLALGDWVIALGSPFGLAETATVGIVSAKHRRLSIADKTYDDLLQTDTAINMGNSGGPLVNLNGDVVGVNSVIQSPTGTSAGVGFAIASSRARTYIEEMMSRGYLGVVMGPYEQKPGTAAAPEGHMCEVRDVLPKGPADAAGIKVGDVILRIDSTDIAGMEEVVNIVGSQKPGTALEVVVFRPSQDREVKLKATVGDRTQY